jgi:nitrate reductase delta subunit
MLVHRILSVLLGYPDAELHTALPEIAATVATADLSTDERAALDAFIIWISHNDPTASEEEYVRTFDLVPEHSLHLTHHLMGEDKNRGPALIDLAEYYKAYGIEIVKSPYAPLVGLLEARSRLVEASGELVTPAAGKTDPCLDDGDFDPPVDWSAPPAAGSACTL